MGASGSLKTEWSLSDRLSRPKLPQPGLRGLLGLAEGACVLEEPPESVQERKAFQSDGRSFTSFHNAGSTPSACLRRVFPLLPALASLIRDDSL